MITYFNSLSSSPNLSKYIDPHMHARFPLMTTIVDEFTAKKIPVPPPHSNAWLTVSQTGTAKRFQAFGLVSEIMSFVNFLNEFAI